MSLSAERAYGAPSFAEEKRMIMQKGSNLQGKNDWRDSVDFRLEFEKASWAVRSDRQVALVAVSVHGLLLQYCSVPLRNDFDVVLAAVSHSAWALKEASEALRGDKEIVLRAVQNDGFTLKYASRELQCDAEVVIAAVRNDGYALQYASDALRGHLEVVQAAVERHPWALQFANDAMKADRGLVIRALSQDGNATERPPRWDDFLATADESLRMDKDIVLMAARSKTHRSQECYNQAHESLKAAIPWKNFCPAAQPWVALAIPGEDAPVLSVSLSYLGSSIDIYSPELAGTFICQAALLSGSRFECRLPDRPASEDEGCLHRRSGPILNDLAKCLVEELPNHAEDARDRRNVFIVFSMESGDDVAVTAWDWERPLVDFLPSDC